MGERCGIERQELHAVRLGTDGGSALPTVRVADADLAEGLARIHDGDDVGTDQHFEGPADEEEHLVVRGVSLLEQHGEPPGETRAT